MIHGALEMKNFICKEESKRVNLIFFFVNFLMPSSAFQYTHSAQRGDWQAAV